ncbi:MAG: methyltransferase domain-containing protein [Pseudomonadota bacterium]
MYRDIYERMRAPWFGDARVLQFSEEPTLDPSWFRSFEVSVFGARNTLDLQAIDRPDGAYDIVMCNNVIEHVADDHSALRELDRVTSDTGFVFLAFPDPLEEARTRAWEYPDPNRFGHYRVYGPDVADRFADALEGRYIVFCQAGDPVTGTHDCAFLITRNGVLADGVLRLLPGSALLDLGDPDCLRALVPTVSRP